jgi:predicted ATPase
LQAKLDKLEALLAQSSTSAPDAALFAEMLSLPNDGRYPVLELTPQQRRQRTLEALILQVVTLSRQNPALIIFEDAQWIDPTSLELFSRIVDRIPTLRVLLIMTYRPEFQPPWLGRPYVTALTVNRLTERQAGAMIDRIVGSKRPPASIRKNIIERSDGIPLFIEEITKAVLEAERQSAAELGTTAIPAVPPTLQASLMARLDRLGAPAKELMQIGAAIGREFSHALLAAVANKPQADVQAALDRIIAAGLLFGQGLAPYATYLFKHSLVQDAAYNTLLRESRRALHGHIADTLERQFADIAETRPEILARHCAEAGFTEKAAGLWGRAGQRSLERSALVEAMEQFTRGLDHIATLPGTPSLRTQQLKLQVGLANALYHTKGFTAVETKAAFDQARAMIERAEAMGEHVEDPLMLYSILYSFFMAKFIPFEGEAACALASQFLELAEQQKATAPIMIGHRLLGTTLFFLGKPVEGLRHIDQALALYDPVTHRSLTTHFGHDVCVASLSLRSWARWLLGYPETGSAEIDHAINVARGSAHAPTLMFALNMTCYTQACCRNYVRASAQIDECMALAEEKGIMHWRFAAMAHRGCMLALTGKPAEAVQTISSGIDGWRSIGAGVFAPFWFLHLALAYADLGKFDDAWRTLGETMTAIETSREKLCEAEINRVAGEIALRSPARDTAMAQAYYERALRVARAQQAKSWELRAAISLALLWRDQGKPQQARELLAPVYKWFTEGFDTHDLKEAKALLDELP